MMLGQSLERPRDARALLGARGRGVGVFTRIGHRALPLLLRHSLGPERPPLRAALAGLVVRDVHHDPEQPRVERRLPAEGRQRLVRLDEGVLRHVPRVFLVAQDVEGQPVHALAILLDERLERRDVTAADPLDEGAVVGLHSSLVSALDAEREGPIHRRAARRRRGRARAPSPRTTMASSPRR
jgi:hypothetical protein